MKKSKNILDLSIIVISYNTRSITKTCLKSIIQSLKHSELTYEIIVIDNNSTDGSPDAIKDLQKANRSIVFLQNKTNEGFAKANNRGAALARGTHLLFLNSDIVVLEAAIPKLVTYYKKQAKHVHFLGGKLLNKNYSDQPSCGPFYTLPVVFAALFLRGDYWNLTRFSPRRVTEVDWVSGACLLTRKKYFTHLGGFDENIFMYMDEIDLLYRAKEKGYRVFFYPDARFIHLGSASSGGRTYPILQVYRGLRYFYQRHKPKSIFFLRVMLKWKAIVGIVIGTIFNNRYLKKTYGEAFKIA